jgi:hypothetical protein
MRRTTEVLAEPLAEVTGQVLTVPVIELYALLWRAGLLEVRHSASKRPPSDLRHLRRAG